MIALAIAAALTGVDISPPVLMSRHHSLPPEYRADPKAFCKHAEDVAYFWAVTKVVIVADDVTLTCEVGKDPSTVPTPTPPKTSGHHWDFYQIDPGFSPTIPLGAECKPGQDPGLVGGAACVADGPPPRIAP